MASRSVETMIEQSRVVAMTRTVSLGAPCTAAAASADRVAGDTAIDSSMIVKARPSTEALETTGSLL